ncbi:DEAD/DEAH box helicase [Promethearchaeum syntrophicum]|uniref:DEAD/DEAH box helicase n=1 Tax=Promethearchaeum syntrophicum TaxID=2594042 RepID=A0A5B9DB47_9ARCH|nr:DEAD/DEAH box helicase [Candidatus Prometheoarchaeum syntrophicum]QEE16342.1 ATP-dependent RNA helicase SrmB [Candidatus Prometheoarchaeum syntrophicum]
MIITTVNQNLFLNIWQPSAPKPRKYQLNIFAHAKKENLLVVIPTGLGKTYIATLLGVHFLKKFEGSKNIIFLAPTRPLISQHIQSHKNHVNLGELGFMELTGKIKPEKRKEIFENPETQFLFMTPQTLRNDLQKELYNLHNTALIIFDEAHRATGEYAYVPIAEFYHKQNPEGRILALTASPGKKEHREMILNNLHIPLKNIERREKQDSDVKDYTHKIDEIIIGVDLTQEMKEIRDGLLEIKEKTIAQYIEFNLNYDPEAPTDPQKYHRGYCAKQVRRLTSALTKNQGGNTRTLRILISMNARLFKIHHLIATLEVQGLDITFKAAEKMKKKIDKGVASKADVFLFRDFTFQKIWNYMCEIHTNTPEKMTHPKMTRLISVISSQLEDAPESRILIFADLRDTVTRITRELNKIPNCRAKKFVGQATKNAADKGLSQKAQIQLLREFSAGTYNILVATCVAQEGLDISECNVVIFYDNSASEIKSIQRSGRTGRSKDGKIIRLYTKNTQEAMNLYITQRRKKGAKPHFHLPNVKPSKSLLDYSNHNKISPPNDSIIPKLEGEKPEISVQINPQIYDAYNLGAAVPVEFAVNKKQGNFDLSFPVPITQVGIAVMNSTMVSLVKFDTLFLRNLDRKKDTVKTFIILLDARDISENDRILLTKRIESIKKITGIGIILFSSIEKFHLMIRTILAKYNKSIQNELIGG